MNTQVMVDFTCRTITLSLYSLYGRKYKLTLEQLKNRDTGDYDEVPVALVESEIDGHEYVCAHFRNMTTRKFFDLMSVLEAYQMRIVGEPVSVD